MIIVVVLDNKIKFINNKNLFFFAVNKGQNMEPKNSGN